MVLAAVAAFAGAAVQSATGFGFALVLSPALFAVLEPAEAVTALLLLGAVLNVLVVAEAGGHARWRSLPGMLAAALPGLVVGAVALAALSREPLQVAVGVAVIAAAVWQLRHRVSPRRVPAAVAGFLSGVLTTSISISGPPLVLWLESMRVPPAEVRATLAAAFLALNAIGALVLAVAGDASVDSSVWPLLALVVAGYGAGALAFRRLDQRHFSNIVLGLVICTGVASMAAGLL
jgi:uncharacterized protein